MRTRLEFTTDDLCMIIWSWQLVFTKGIDATHLLRRFLTAVLQHVEQHELFTKGNAVASCIPKTTFYSNGVEHTFLVDGVMSFCLKRPQESIYDWDVYVGAFHGPMSGEDPLFAAYCVLRREKDLRELQLFNAKPKQAAPPQKTPKQSLELVEA